jgi:hypothetical protein
MRLRDPPRNSISIWQDERRAVGAAPPPFRLASTKSSTTPMNDTAYGQRDACEPQPRSAILNIKRRAHYGAKGGGSGGEEREMVVGAEAPSAWQRVLTPDEMRLAAHAGSMVIATTPGAPRGVIAPGGLPRVARLVGREPMIERLLAALASREEPVIITLTGAPGVGKSVLAAEAVARAAERELFPGGVIWLACEGLSGEPGIEHILDQLGHALGEESAASSTRALLALDHIEPSLDANALLDALEPLHYALLLTARHSLQDERSHDEPLVSLDALASAELVQHILRQVDPGRPTEEDDEKLFDALTHDGSPLALSLGAALIAVMGLPLDHITEIATMLPFKSLNAARMALPIVAQRAWFGLALIEGASFPRGVALAVVGVAISETLSASTDTLDESWREEAAETLDALIGLGLVSALATGRLALQPLSRRVAAYFLRQETEEARNAAGDAMTAWWLDFARSHPGHSGATDLVAEAAGLMGAIALARDHQRHQTVYDLIDVVRPAWRAFGPASDDRYQRWSDEAARALVAGAAPEET